MRKLLLVLFMIGLFLFPSNISFAMDDSEVVSSFKQYVEDSLAQVTPTYQGNHYNMDYDDFGLANDTANEYAGWSKSTSVFDPEYKIGIEKTNSLISPYTGTLLVKIRHITYLTHKDKVIAENETVIHQSVSYTSYFLFSLAYQNGIWNITSIKLDNNYIPSTNSLTDILSCKDKIRK